jgi:carbon storage regulator
VNGPDDHLDKGQKIALALEIEPHFAEEAEIQRRKKISESRRGEMVANVPPSQKSRDQAAAAVGVSGKLVSAANGPRCGTMRRPHFRIAHPPGPLYIPDVMLVLTRKTNQTIVIGNTIRVTVLAVHGGVVQIGVDAPKSVTVMRGELTTEQTPHHAHDDAPQRD